MWTLGVIWGTKWTINGHFGLKTPNIFEMLGNWPKWTGSIISKKFNLFRMLHPEWWNHATFWKKNSLNLHPESRQHLYSREQNPLIQELRMHSDTVKFEIHLRQSRGMGIQGKMPTYQNQCDHNCTGHTANEQHCSRRRATRSWLTKTWEAEFNSYWNLTPQTINLAMTHM